MNFRDSDRELAETILNEKLTGNKTSVTSPVSLANDQGCASEIAEKEDLITRTGSITAFYEAPAEYDPKIIDCLAAYLKYMPAGLKETKRMLDALGFYEHRYKKRMEYISEAKKRLISNSKFQ